MKKSLLLSAFLLSLLVSCKKQETKDDISKNYSQLKKAGWLIGNWENSNKEMQMKEIWNYKNDSCYVAESYITVQKDTVFYEKMDLYQVNDSVIMKISVRDQNKEKPVSFYLSKSNEKELVFENPKHDFPTKIVYTKISNDSLVAAIYGKKDGKELSELFPMKKTK